MWTTPLEKNLPSAHDVIVGNQNPTKTQRLSKRVPKFCVTINVLLYKDQVCCQGSDNEAMNISSPTLSITLDLMGIGRDEAWPNGMLSYAE